MLHKIKITAVDQGQKFYHAGRTYVLANASERAKHPAGQRACVQAYHLPEKGDRVPVGFNALTEVYVHRI